MSSRSAHILSFLFALGILALLAYSLMGPTPMVACGGLARGYQPIIAFELARSTADLQAVFGHGASACRDAARVALANVNFADNFIFIPVYTLFIVFFFLGMSSRDPLLSRVAIAVAVAAALGDWVENHNLVLLAASPNAPPADALQHLEYATGVKWMALAISNFIAGLIFLRRGGLWNVLAFALCTASLILTGLALRDPPSFGPQISNAIVLGWLVFLAMDIRELVRPRRQPA